MRNVSSLLQRAWSSAKRGEAAFCFFDGADGTFFRRGVDEFAATQGARVLRASLLPGALPAPYHPYLGMAAECQRGCGEAAAVAVAAAGVYGAQRPAFAAALQGLPARRGEPPICHEVAWEKQQARESLLRLLAWYAGEDGLVLAVDGLEHAPPSTLDLLAQAVERPVPGRLLYACRLDRNVLFGDEADETRWERFVSGIERAHFFNELDVTGDPPSPPWMEGLAAGAPADAREACARAETALSLLAPDEAGRAAETVLEQGGGDPFEQARLLELAGDGCALRDDPDAALQAYERALERVQHAGDPAALAGILRRTCWAYIARNDYEHARDSGQQAARFAERAGDPAGLALAWFALYYVGYRFTIVVVEDLFGAFLRRLMGELDRLGFVNTLAFCCHNYYLSLSFHIPGLDVEEVRAACERGVSLAEEHGNLVSLAAGYHSLGMIHTYLKDYAGAIRWYERSAELRVGMGDQLEIVRINHSIGYYYTQQDDYARAYERYAQAAASLRPFRDYNEIAVNLYNFAWLYFSARRWSDAAHYLEKLLQLMRLRGMSYIPYRNLYDIYALKGLCHARLGDSFRAAQCLHKCRGLTGLNVKLGYFFSGLLEADVAWSDGDHEAAEAGFRRALEVLDPAIDTDRRLVPLHRLEYGTYLAARGRALAADDLFRSGMEACRELGMPAMLRWLEEIAAGGIRTMLELPSSRPDLDDVLEIAKLETRLSRTQRIVREVRMLNVLQAIAESARDEQAYAVDALQVLGMHFPAGVGYLRLWAADGPGVTTSFETDAPDPRVAAALDEAYRGLPAPRLLADVTLPGAGGPATYPSAIVMPIRGADRELGLLFLAVAGKEVRFSGQDLEVITAVGNQVANAVTRRRTDAQLVRMSTTDPLTGLANRQALQNRLADEFARVLRYRDRQDPRLSVALIDLDNFKHCNDAYGHAAGDLVLAAFARLLRETFRETDFLARYGGDEFLVLMPSTAAPEALVCAERLVARLAAADSFRAELASALGVTVDPAPDRRLGCSVGLATHLGDGAGPKNGDELMKAADQALYSAKAGGKNRVAAWNPESA